jgi:hypothetical protein
MQNAWFVCSSIAASGSKWSEGTISLHKARTLTITTRVTFGGSIDADTTVYVYYSPDGVNWDTYAYTSYVLTYDAGETEQETVIIDPPEHGYMRTKITNGSSADTLTDVKQWYTIQSWGERKGSSKGSITADTGDED